VQGAVERAPVGVAGVSTIRWLVSTAARCGRRRVSLVAVSTTERDMLWAMTCRASQAALAPKRPEGRSLRPAPYFRSRIAFSTTAWPRCHSSTAPASPDRSVGIGPGRGVVVSDLCWVGGLLTCP
jgi:hypothetical protein